MLKLFPSLPRALLILACLFALVRSTRMGMADWFARRASPEDFARAMSMEPRNTRWDTNLAVLRYQSGDGSIETIHDLERVSLRRPYDAEPLMALGLLAEQRGDLPAAEKFLQNAVRIDHRFKPAWTLANFYYRTGNTAKIRAPIAACLDLIEPRNLEPWSFEPAPVFHLAWAAWNNPDSVLAMIPKRRETLVPFLSFLIANNDPAAAQAAQKAWPEIVRIAEPTDRRVLLNYVDHLVRVGPGSQAIRVWNDLLDKNVVTGRHLKPDAGQTFADPDFAVPFLDHGFGWYSYLNQGIATTLSPHAFSMEFTGNEADRVELLTTHAAVIAGRKYMLRWTMEAPNCLGLHSQISWPGNTRDLGTPDGQFTAPDKLQIVEIRLSYQRPQGQVRLRNTVVIHGIRLEPVS